MTCMLRVMEAAHRSPTMQYSRVILEQAIGGDSNPWCILGVDIEIIMPNVCTIASFLT
eukprot:SAG31_NODE_538_length_14312_cov_12.542461_7_plen_58_part_00